MLKTKILLVCLAGAFALSTQTASSQMVVHAVGGTVMTINPASKSIHVPIEDGTKDHFATSSKSKVAMNFDKDLHCDAVDADTFHALDSFVVIYYYGYGDSRTAVAIKDLGKGTLEKFNGTVLDFDKHDHMLTVQTQKVGTVKFDLGE